MTIWVLVSLFILIINVIALSVLITNYFALKRKFAGMPPPPQETVPAPRPSRYVEELLPERGAPPANEPAPADRPPVDVPDVASVDTEAAALFSKLGETSTLIRDASRQLGNTEDALASPHSSEPRSLERTELLDKICEQIEARRHDSASRAFAELIRALYLDESPFRFAALADLSDAECDTASALIAAKLRGAYSVDDWELAFERTRIVLSLADE